MKNPLENGERVRTPKKNNKPRRKNKENVNKRTSKKERRRTAHHVDSPDVTGAGDTVIAALSIAYAKTQDIELSARFANNAAATAVSKSGTATVTINEINNYIESNI